MIEPKPYLSTPGIPTRDEDLNLTNLSILYRFSLLAKTLHLRIPVLFSIRNLVSNDPSYPFASVKQTTEFIEIVNKIINSGYSIAELNYLYRNIPASLVPWYAGRDPAPLQKNVTMLLEGLQSEIKKIEMDNTTHGPDPSGTVLQSKLPLVIDKTLVETAFNIINGSSKASDPDKKQFIEANFAHFLDPIEAENILIPSSSTNNLNVEKKYSYILQQIEKYIVKSLTENLVIQSLSQELSIDNDITRLLLISSSIPLKVEVDSSSSSSLTSPAIDVLYNLVGDGLSAEYFDTDHFAGLKKNSVDKEINFNWGRDSPDFSIIPSTSDNDFSIIWSGKLLAQYDEDYTFFLRLLGTVTLLINGTTIIDNSAMSHAALKSPA